MQKLEGTDLIDLIVDHTDIHIGMDTVEATLPFMAGMEVVAVSLASVFCSAALHVLFVFVYARAHARILIWAVITLIRRAEATIQRLWLLKSTQLLNMADLLMDSLGQLLEAIHNNIHHSMVNQVCSQECNPCNTTSK